MRIVHRFAVLALLPLAALAQDFPSRNISIVVPYPPGGVVDTVAPLLVSTQPGNATTDIAANSDIVLEFDSLMAAGAGTITPTYE